MGFQPKHVLVPLALLFGLSTGCADDEPLTVELRNQGAVCIAQQPVFLSGTEVTIAADEPAQVGVLFRSCISSCTENLETSCSAEFDAETSTITITSRASWQRQDVMQCNLACRVVEATCDGPTLPEGTYTVVHGDEEETLTVPSTFTCATNFPDRQQDD